MIIPSTYKGKKVGVFGLARTGLTAVEALQAAGAHVYAWDDDAVRCTVVGKAAQNLYTLDFDELDYLMIAPGVPLTHPEPHALVKKAQHHGVPVIGDFDLFAAGQNNLPDHKTVVITGTNGKSTTTALVHHMLEFAGVSVAMGGNIGTGVLSLPMLQQGGVYVLEMSSYQIDLTHTFAPDIAVLLNITPDHLDRHGDMGGYIHAKSRLFDLLSDDGAAIIAADDGYCESLMDSYRSHGKNVQALAVGSKKINDGVSIADHLLFEMKNGQPLMIGSVEECNTLRGYHNWQNMTAAYAVGIELGLDRQVILGSFMAFPGLVHRQEVVGDVGGITFVNDSKATNQESAAKALSSFQNIHWIAGGRAKEHDLQAIAHWMHHVKQAYFIGEAAPLFHDELQDHVNSTVYASLNDAFHAACDNAQSGDVILLSPACSAFDQFKDFEDRGHQFRTLVSVRKGNLS